MVAEARGNIAWLRTWAYSLTYNKNELLAAADSLDEVTSRLVALASSEQTLQQKLEQIREIAEAPGFASRSGEPAEALEAIAALAADDKEGGKS